MSATKTFNFGQSVFPGDQRGGYNNRGGGGFDRGNDRYGNRGEQDSNWRRGNSSTFERNDSYGSRFNSRGSGWF